MDDTSNSQWQPRADTPPPAAGPPPERASSLPPPVPSVAPAAPSAPPPPPAPPADVLNTGPIEPTPASGGGRWAGRGLAVVLALGIVGGGAYLAFAAGGSDGGAESPEAAAQQLFDAIAAEDVIGAAEVLEPAERDAFLDLGVATFDELVRLEVFSDELDLTDVGGFDIEFQDLSFDAELVRDDVANVAIAGGDYTASFDAREFPIGPLVTDRVDPEWFSATDTESGSLVDADDFAVAADRPSLAAVERDGRWYVSLAYTVGELARVSEGLAFPSAAQRVAPLGAESAEAAVRGLVDSAVELDLRGAIGHLDPEEMAALYDYAPLFLPDVEREAAEVLADAEAEGVTWEVDSLELNQEGDGDRATVVVDRVGFSMTGPEMQVDLELAGDTMTMEMVEVYDGEEHLSSIVVDGRCFTETYDGETNESCVDESDLAELGPMLDMFESFEGSYGIETHRVDGRWYVSPIRTFGTPMLGFLEGLEPQDLRDLVDFFETESVEMFEGMSEFEAIEQFEEVGEAIEPLPSIAPRPSDGTGSDDGGTDDTATDGDEGSTTDDETVVPSIDELPGTVEPLNTDLIAESIQWEWATDLDQAAADELREYFGLVGPPLAIERGIEADVSLAGGLATLAIFETGSEAAAEAYVAAVGTAPGAAVVPEPFPFVTLPDWAGDPMFVVADGSQVVMVVTYGAPHEQLVELFTIQVVS